MNISKAAVKSGLPVREPDLYIPEKGRFMRFKKVIAASLSLVYDEDDIKTDKSKASVELEYELVNWKNVFDDVYSDFEEAGQSIKNEQAKLRVSGKIDLAEQDGEWMISKVSKLDEVFAFTSEEPDIADTTETVQTETSAAVTSDPYNAAVNAYIELLETNSEVIKHAEKVYSKDYCGIYDINGDGIPELYFIAADDADDMYSSATLYVYRFDVFLNKAYMAVMVPEIVYSAQGGGFILYVTPDEFVITHRHGEEALVHVETDVYSADVEYRVSLMRDAAYEYDPENDLEIYTYEYYRGYYGNYDTYSETEYNATLRHLVSKAFVVLASDYAPLENEIEYPLNSLPDNGFVSFDEMLTYLNSLK